MAENSKIQWTDHTFNPWRGCTKVAAGCANCYAESLSKRNPGTLGQWGSNGTRVLASESMWRQPLKWDREAAQVRASWEYAVRTCVSEYDSVEPYERPRVFCASLADVFEDWPGQLRMSDGRPAVKVHVMGRFSHFQGCNLRGGNDAVTLSDARARLFRLIDATPNLDWLLLTKRPESIRRMWTLPLVAEREEGGRAPWLRRNVWLGTSVATQEDADRNIPELLKCRDLSSKLFLSVEPLLGPVDLTRLDNTGGERYDALRAEVCTVGRNRFRTSDTSPLDWVIVGGESGPHARPCNVEWIRSIVRQCSDAGVPSFVKQLGSLCLHDDGASRCRWPGLTQFTRVTEGCKVRLRDSKGGDPAEWPEDLRVREFPRQ